MNFNNLKIGTRLGMAFFIVILFTALTSFMAWYALNSVNDKWQEFANVSLEKRRLANNANAQVGDAVHQFKDFVLRGGDYEKKFEDDMAGLETFVSTYSAAGEIGEKEKMALDSVRTGIGSYRAAMAKAVEMKRSGSSIEEIDKSIKGADKAIAKAIEEILVEVRKEAAAAGKSIGESVSLGEKLTISLTCIVILLSTIFAWIVTRSITVPISRAVTIAQSVANGDLTTRIEAGADDETGQLLNALGTMNESLTRIVNQVRSGTENIASASQQISMGNLDLSSRTEQQAASLEETASSMEELTSTVRQNTENSREANKLAMSASEVAVEGGMVVSKVVSTMNAINESAAKIVEIIAVIDGIAFQTNILALNAAVEAARAGEQGRGFAVVASEVRNLAQRSAAAAKEIKALIGNAVDSAKAGGELVDHAGQTMERVVASVKRVAEVITEITSAGQEQDAGIEQINQAVLQMDQVTQQNAALVEEAAAAATSLHDQADRLVDMVRVFKTADQSSPVAFKSVDARKMPERRTPFLNSKPSLTLIPA